MSEKKKRQASSQADSSEVGKQLSLPVQEDNNEMANADEGSDFEASLSELEGVVQKLEGEVKLEEALQLFDRGIQLSQHCQEFLKSAEQKIEIVKKAANGTLAAEKFIEESLQNS